MTTFRRLLYEQPSSHPGEEVWDGGEARGWGSLTVTLQRVENDNTDGYTGDDDDNDDDDDDDDDNNDDKLNDDASGGDMW